MRFLGVMKAGLLIAVLFASAGTVQAKQYYMDVFNASTRTNTYNCSICHQSPQGGDLPVTKPFSAEFKTNWLPNVIQDSVRGDWTNVTNIGSNVDGDLFNDLLEVALGGDLNAYGTAEAAYGRPFTISTNIAGYVLTNGCNLTNAFLNNPPTVPMQTGQSVVGLSYKVSLAPPTGTFNFTSCDVTLVDSSSGVLADTSPNAIVNVYDVYSGVNEITNFKVTPNGAVTVTLTSPNAELVVVSTERKIGFNPSIPANASTVANAGDSGGGGCVTGTGTLSFLYWFMMMVAVALLMKRKVV